MRLRTRLLALLSALLAACGGGSSESSTVVAFYGDSITAAPWFSPTPVQQMAEMMQVQAEDFSQPGMTTKDALPWVTQTLSTSRASVVVIRFGMADLTTTAGQDVEFFAGRLVAVIQQVRDSGRIPVLTTTTRLAPWPEFTDEMNTYYLKMLDVYNAQIRQVADASGVRVIDVYADVPFAGSADLRDIVHPAQGYSTRVSQHIANWMRRIL